MKNKLFKIAVVVVAILAPLGFWVPYRAEASTFGYVQQIKMSETTGTGSYTSSAFGSALTVGNVLIAAISSDGNVATEITGVSDSKSNTWTKDINRDDTREVSIWHAPITTGGTGDTITITYNGANSNNSGAVIQEWSYGTGTFTKDQTMTGTGTSATPTTGASSNTTVANELVVGAFVMTSTEATFAAGSTYSNASSSLVTNANIGIESKEISSTGAQTATSTWATSRIYSAALATYYVAGGGGGGTTDTNLHVIFNGKVILNARNIIIN